MVKFADVLRQSRAATLVKTLSSRASASVRQPSSQHIATSRAGRASGDWGLKRSLPNLKTGSISISAIDSPEHLTIFDPTSAFAKVRDRWDEAHAATRQPRHGLYDDTSSSNLDDSRGQIRRRDIRKARAHRRGSRSTQYSGDGATPTEIASANVGLSYHPPGSASVIATPSGTKEKVVPARVLQSRRAARILGLGGIALQGPASGFDARANTDQGRFSVVQIHEVEYSHEAQSGIVGHVSSHESVQSPRRSLTRGSARWATVRDGESR